MKRIFLFSLLALSVCAALLVFAPPALSAEPQRKIVVFKEGILKSSEQDRLIDFLGGQRVKDLKLINGKVAYLSRSAEETLKINPAVMRVDNDAVVRATEDTEPVKISLLDSNFFSSLFNTLLDPIRLPILRIRNSRNQPPQSVPWGIKYEGADLVWTNIKGDGVRVAVIDTGVDLKHPDLKDNIKGGYNAINPFKSVQDDNGHGTHVIGVVAASNNDVGVVGVAPKASIYAVKSLNANGMGYVSDVIDGIDWAISQNMQIINMSLGSSENVQSLQDAVNSALNNNIVVVAAAGNSGGAVSYPAKYPGVLAISAIDQQGVIAGFSSRGQEISFAAPGVNIFSTYKDQSYETLSGTSMASPHVAGIIALLLSQPVGLYDANLNGQWDNSEVMQKLKDSAIDLGDAGKDNLYGYGSLYAPTLFQ